MQISNGTVMVIERYYESNIDPIPMQASSFTAYSYKLLHGPDFSLVKFSATHCFDFIKGMLQLVEHYLHKDTPAPMKRLLLMAQKQLDKDQFRIIHNNINSADIPVAQMLQLAQFLRYDFKQNMMELIAIYAQMDAWYGMALSIKTNNLVFPEFMVSSQPFIEVKGLYHILLIKPVAYEVSLSRDTNFLFLTGANMAGKSTFIKSVGTAVFLAHTGMGVPAQSMRLSVFDGILSNINVIDNIVKGESYFYNEVQRIKSTINKINDGRKWLILIDELFKGTNIQDAMKCSTVVIEGLLKIKIHYLFYLPTCMKLEKPYKRIRTLLSIILKLQSPATNLHLITSFVMALAMIGSDT